jgi:hypothetical protein
MNVRRDLEDGKAFAQGLNNTITARALLAHKAPEITGIRHDAAIVFAPRPFVLVVLTRGGVDSEQGSDLIAGITRQLYRATQ